MGGMKRTWQELADYYELDDTERHDDDYNEYMAQMQSERAEEYEREQKESFIIQSFENDVFANFHHRNPHVYDMFESFTLQLIGAGHRRGSAEMIINRMRWETALETTEIQFKINNNYKPLYARMFAFLNPEHEKFFSFRD